MRNRLLIAAMAVCVPFGTACASASGEPVPAAARADTGYGEADLQFSQEMIPHHRQTVQLAELAAARAGSAYVRRLGARLAASEREDIALMESWLRSWRMPVPDDDPEQAHAMPGMISAEQLETLEELSGAEFDRAWLTLLSRHLGNGVEMAETVKAQGTHEPTVKLATELITAQRATIAEIAGRLA